MAHRRTIGVGLLGSITLCACSMQPAYVRPDAVIASRWPVQKGASAPRAGTRAEIDITALAISDKLRRLLSLAITKNQDVRAAVANIEATRALYRIERAGLFPQIDLSADYSHSDTGNGASTGPASGVREQYRLQASTSAFELDLFGRVRSLRSAALDRYLASEEGARAARLSLAGEVASLWLTHASDKEMLAVARETEASAATSVRLTQARVDRGVSSRTDLRQAQAIWVTARADIARRTTAIAQDINALASLTGDAIEPALLSRDMDEAMAAIGKIAAGTSSAILLNRPDVMAAEFELKATYGDIGAARAALLPTISLTGLGGLASSALSSLLTGGAFARSATAAISYPVFRAGSGRAALAYSEATRDAALARYHRSIQIAFKEVGDALARQDTVGDEIATRQIGVSAARDALRLTDARYRGGIDSFLANLEAQRTFYQSRQALVTLQLDDAINRIRLFQALGGGGFSPMAPVASADAIVSAP